jgi:hypothetical protein
MWLFFLVIALILMWNYRSYFRDVATKMKVNGVEAHLLQRFEKQYPTYTTRAYEHLRRFNEQYQRTFDYKNWSKKTIEKMFSIRDDVLYNIDEIKLRLPNDLDMEEAIVGAREQTDRRMMEYITDTKSRFNINIYPGQTSSAFAAKHYRAANDYVS